MKSYIMLFMGLCFLNLAAAQKTKYRPLLTVGNKVPENIRIKLINYSKSVTTLNEFNDKLLILDFWATTCGTCVEQFPRLNKLRNQFAGKVNILPVTPQSSKDIIDFFHRVKYLKDIHMPIVTEDTTLFKLFQPNFIPHEVWINKEGMVIAVTDHEYVNEKNISAICSGQIPHWPIKKDDPEFDLSKSIMQTIYDGTGTNSNSFYSVLIGHIKDLKLKAGIQIDAQKKSKRYYFINHDILHLYAIAYQNGQLVFQPSRVTLEVSDSSRYLYNQEGNNYTAWRDRNTFSYEAVVPIEMSDQDAFNQLRQNLDAFLRLSSRIETRPVNSLVLKFKKGAGKALITDNRPFVFELDDLYPVKQIINANLSGFIWKLNHTRGLPPIIDETGISEKVDIVLSISSLSNLTELKAALSEYGLYLEPAVREMEMFVLREKPTAN